MICNTQATKGTSGKYGPEQHITGDPNCPQGRAHPGCIAKYERFVKKQLAAAHEIVAARTLDAGVAAYQTRQAVRTAEAEQPPGPRYKRPRNAPTSQLEGLVTIAGPAPSSPRRRRGRQPRQWLPLR